MDTEPTEARDGSRAAKRAAEPKIQLTSVEPRIFGVVPPTLALVLGLVALIAGIVILASGEVASAIVLAILGLVLGPSRSIRPAAGRPAPSRGSR